MDGRKEKVMLQSNAEIINVLENVFCINMENLDLPDTLSGIKNPVKLI